MFEISQLKEKSLVELQKIAKEIGLPKFSQLNKLDLVYQILDHQAANPVKVSKPTTTASKGQEKPKRARISKPKSSGLKVPSENSKPKETTKETPSRPIKVVKESSPQLDLKLEEKKEEIKPQKREERKPQHNHPKKEVVAKEENTQPIKKENTQAAKTENKPTNKPDHSKSKPQHKDQKTKNKSGNRYRDPDYEFDGIIESEGVLE